MLAVKYDAIAFIFFKISIVLVAALCFILGFKLFLKGITPPSGDLKVTYKSWELILFKAAPGTYLFVMGTIISCFTIFNSKFNSTITSDSDRRQDSTLAIQKIDTSFIYKDQLSNSQKPSSILPSSNPNSHKGIDTKKLKNTTAINNISTPIQRSVAGTVFVYHLLKLPKNLKVIDSTAISNQFKPKNSIREN